MELIHKYFPNLTEKQYKQLEQLKEVYLYWNERINVISRKDTEQFYERHVLHSLTIAHYFQFKPGQNILDLGTGGGFPGIPLAILFPETKFHLVDSIGKKIKVVNEVAKAIGLENVVAEQSRVEDLPNRYDFVVTRAVALLSKIIPWVHAKLIVDQENPENGGIICLKGGDLSEELKDIKWMHKQFNLNDIFQTEFFETKKIIHCIPKRK